MVTGFSILFPQTGQHPIRIFQFIRKFLNLIFGTALKKAGELHLIFFPDMERPGDQSSGEEQVNQDFYAEPEHETEIPYFFLIVV
jgi:hypothetical protein